MNSSSRQQLNKFLVMARRIERWDDVTLKWPNIAAHREKERKASWEMLEQMLLRDDRKSVDIALAGVMIGWAAGMGFQKSADAFYRSKMQSIKKEVPLRFILREMRAAKKRFDEDPKGRGHKFDFKAAQFYWNPKCSFRITRQRFTMWNKETRKFAAPVSAKVKDRKR